MSGRCVVEAISGGKVSPASRSKRKTQSFPHLRRSLDTRGLRVWLEEGRLIAFVPSGKSPMKGAVAVHYSFLPLDQKSSKYFCKHPKIKLCQQRYFLFFEILSDLNQAVPNHLADESQTR